MKIVGVVVLGALMAVGYLAVNRFFGGSNMEIYKDEDNQSLTVTANKANVIARLFSDRDQPQGRYFLEKRDGTTKGRFTRDEHTYNLKDEGGKEWNLTIQPDLSLRDQNGVVWRHRVHAESDLTVEQNRATCEKLVPSPRC
jgi:hypothetical protein